MSRRFYETMFAHGVLAWIAVFITLVWLRALGTIATSWWIVWLPLYATIGVWFARRLLGLVLLLLLWLVVPRAWLRRLWR